jgi:hypothetical protein
MQAVPKYNATKVLNRRSVVQIKGHPAMWPNNQGTPLQLLLKSLSDLITGIQDTIFHRKNEIQSKINYNKC